jgi:hypothetical protein
MCSSRDRRQHWASHAAPFAVLVGVLAAPAPAGAVEVQPVADTYVDARKPRSSYGSARTLHLSSTPVRRAYLRFETPAAIGTPTRAVLHLYLRRRAGGRVGVQSLRQDAGWTERRTSFSQAPGTIRATVRSPRVRRRGWVAIDVTRLIARRRRTDLALTGARRASVASRESARPPRLTLDVPASPPILAPGPVAPGRFAPTPRRPAWVTITQDTEPDVGAGFSYAVTGMGPFRLVGDGSRTVRLPASGLTTISQRPLPGWTLAAVSCTGAARSDLDAARVSIDVAPGERTECRFHVQRDASVTVLQDTEPTAGPRMAYTSSLGDFALEGGDQHTLTVRPGDFGEVTIAQAPVEEWVSSAPTCRGDAAAVTTARGVTLTVEPGETIQCRFAVMQPAPIAGIFPETSSNLGPFIDRNGNLYTVTEVAQEDNRAAMRRSTDGGRTWSEVDSARRPVKPDLESVSLVQDGTRIHMLHQTTYYKVFYSTFNTSDSAEQPDSWDIRDEQPFEGFPAPLPAAAPNDQSVSLAVRDNGEVVAFYAISDTEIAFSTRSPDTGAWGPPRLLETAAIDTALTQVFVARSTLDDTVHVAYKEHTRTAGLRSRILYRSLSPDDVLSPPVTVAVDAVSGNTAYKAMPNQGLVVTNAGATERVHVAWARTDGRLVSSAIDAGVPGPEQRISDAVTYENPINVKSFQVVGALAADADLGVVRALYADAEWHDLWADRRMEDWGSDLELLDGYEVTDGDRVEVMAISANVLTHATTNGGRKVLAIVFDQDTGVADAGAVRYAEVELDVPPPP